MSSYEASLRAAVFADHLCKQPNIQPTWTNFELIHAIFACYEERKPGATVYQCGRGTGVTRTLKEWVLWMDQPVTVVTSHPFPWQKLKGPRVAISGWDNPIVGLYARFTLLDSPFDGVRCTARAYDFTRWLQQYPHPAFYVDQRVY